MQVPRLWLPTKEASTSFRSLTMLLDLPPFSLVNPSCSVDHSLLQISTQSHLSNRRVSKPLPEFKKTKTSSDFERFWKILKNIQKWPSKLNANQKSFYFPKPITLPYLFLSFLANVLFVFDSNFSPFCTHLSILNALC